MKLVGVLSTAVLSLTLGVGIPAYAQQEQHQQQEDKEKTGGTGKEREKREAGRQKKPEEKNAGRKKQQDGRGKSRKRRNRKRKPRRSNIRSRLRRNSVPAPWPHSRRPFQGQFRTGTQFRVSQADYRDRRFQYGGYWFGFACRWPSNWLYTQDVYVIEIDGVYYLCNASYPGVNLTLSFTI